MKITRIGSDRNRGLTTLLDREPESVSVEIDPEGSGVKFRFCRVLDPLDSNFATHHDYTVVLSRKDLAQVLDRLLLGTIFGND